jgi:hypothetical protein
MQSSPICLSMWAGAKRPFPLWLTHSGLLTMLRCRKSGYRIGFHICGGRLEFHSETADRK